jgi:outer membrane immunogenic protein
MKIFFGAAFLVAAAAIAGPARAADLPAANYYSAPAPLSGFNWMGPYLGANVGYEWGNVSHNPTNPSGIAGGIEAGYNWQFGQFVTGVETDIQASVWHLARPRRRRHRQCAGVRQRRSRLRQPHRGQPR